MDERLGVACITLKPTAISQETDSISKLTLPWGYYDLGLVMFPGEKYASPIYFNPPNSCGYVAIRNENERQNFDRRCVRFMNNCIRNGTPMINGANVSLKESSSPRPDEF